MIYLFIFNKLVILFFLMVIVSDFFFHGIIGFETVTYMLQV